MSEWQTPVLTILAVTAFYYVVRRMDRPSGFAGPGSIGSRYGSYAGAFC